MASLKPADSLPRKEYIPIGIVLLMFAIASLSYNHLPDSMPTHWNARGEIDGYSSKAVGLFIIPVITLALYLLMSFLPYAALYSDGVKSFHFLMYAVKLSFVGFMLLMQLITILPAIGISFNMNLALIPLFAMLLFAMGILIGRAKRNYFIGIRTPWTLASDDTWNRTHTLGSKGFKIISLVVLLSVLVIDYSIFIMISLLIGFSLFLVAYSYWISKKG
jgi:uncharacterized membrane protein